MLKKVGITKISYSDVEYGDDEWVDAKKFTPSSFDLVKIKTDEKTINGWYTGERWYALRLKKNEEVLFWKRLKEIY